MRADGLYVAVQVELDGRSLWIIVDTGKRETTFYEGWLEEMREATKCNREPWDGPVVPWNQGSRLCRACAWVLRI